MTLAPHTSLTEAQRRQRWRRVCDVARAAAIAPDSTDRAVALKQALRGLDARSFPLLPGDVRLIGVKGFLEVERLWIAGGPTTRTAFASSLAALAADLERILLAQGAERAQAEMQRQGLT